MDVVFSGVVGLQLKLKHSNSGKRKRELHLV